MEERRVGKVIEDTRQGECFKILKSYHVVI